MNILQKIVMLYYEINNIYLELYRLELKQERKSITFLELINLLKEKILEEEIIYSTLTKKELKVISNLVNNEDNPFYKRIIDYINYYNVIDISPKEYEDEARLYDICSKNILLMYLSFLQEYIDLSNNQSINLLKYKYHNSFINHDIEKKLIEFSFDIPKTNYVNTYLFSNTIHLNSKIYDMVTRQCYLDTINIVIEQLLLISDNNYSDNESETISINNQCMLRSCMSLLSNTDYNKIHHQILEQMERLSNSNNRISTNIIKSIIGRRNKDRERVIKISIEPIDY